MVEYPFGDRIPSRRPRVASSRKADSVDGLTAIHAVKQKPRPHQVSASMTRI